MKVIATNIGKKKTVVWNNQEVQTGIFKSAVSAGIYLMKEDVKNDDVVDRKYHGGIDKACYAYSFDCYSFWKEKFPNLDFETGIFGENLTIEGLNEAEIKIGNQYKVGEAIIEVSQPRQPCFKLGIRFDTQTVLKEFINAPFSGIYFRVLKPGLVKKNDQLILIMEHDSEPTVLDVHKKKFLKVSRAQEEKISGSKFLSKSYFN